MSVTIKVIELRKAILSFLKIKHPRAYYQAAPDNAAFPYLVFDLPNSTDDGAMERFILEVDGWDKSKDTIAIETLMDSVDKELHRKTVILADAISATFYRENRIPLRDDDPKLCRRKYVYQVRTHGE
jgi:hypothetical protein